MEVCWNRRGKKNLERVGGSTEKDVASSFEKILDRLIYYSKFAGLIEREIIPVISNGHEPRRAERIKKHLVYKYNKTAR